MTKTPAQTSTNQPTLKVALVHDYLREFGGAERVLEALHDLYPEAPVYTAFFDREALGVHAERFTGWEIRETWLSKIPFFKKLHSPLRFLAPWAFASLDMSEYDLVISSSNAYFAKAVKVPNGKHLCYCHTPPRVLYGYSAMSDWQSNPVMRVAGQLLNHFMRVIDVKVSRERVDQFVANSHETASRIKKFYRLDSTVVYPPVELAEVDSTKVEKGDYFLYVNRLALAKHPELAVEVCSKLNLPLKVVGSGKMLASLQAMAGPTVEFLGAVDDQQLAKLYAGAKALLYPVEHEDFGIVPVEAMLYGTPVIAHNSGGPKETVINGKSGLVFDDLTVVGLETVLTGFAQQKFSATEIKAWAKKFSKTAFNQGIKKAVTETLAK
jgi:glycosyltransferase involved in cell wall biosynthesis